MFKEIVHPGKMEDFNLIGPLYIDGFNGQYLGI